MRGGRSDRRGKEGVMEGREEGSEGEEGALSLSHSLKVTGC